MSNADECKRFAGERERFEAAMCGVLMAQGYSRAQVPSIMSVGLDGKYQTVRIEGAWMGWQARAAQPAPAVPEKCADMNHHERYRAGWNACRAAMLAAAPAQGQQVEWRTTAVMLEQANAGLAQLNGKLRAELSALKAQQVGQKPVEAVHLGWDYLDDRTKVATYFVPCPGDTPPKLYTAPQPAPAQDVTAVLKMARALSDRQADACNVDREDQWKLYSADFVADVEAMLAAARDKQSGEVKP